MLDPSAGRKARVFIQRCPRPDSTNSWLSPGSGNSDSPRDGVKAVPGVGPSGLMPRATGSGHSETSGE